MPDSTRKRILAALLARVQQVRVANGFATDAGAHVDFGPLVVSTDDPRPRAAVTPGTVEVEPKTQGSDVTLQFTVSGLIDWAPASPLLLEDLLADLKRAVFAPDRSLGGLLMDGSVAFLGESVAPLEEGGRNLVCAVVGEVHYSEEYGQP